MFVAYTYIVWAVLVIFAIAGGWLGWWHATKSLYVRNIGAEVFGETSMKPAVLVRRQLRRIVWTVAGTAVGAFIGMNALVALTRFQT